MFGDRIQQTTTSTGAVLTLGAASTNMRAFSAALSTAGANCQYAMRSEDGTEWETGFGRLTGANQVTRDYATANSSGTAPTILAFSAGTKYVTCTPIARGMLAAMPNVIAGADPKLISNRFCQSANASGFMTEDRVYYVPLFLEQACRVKTIGFYVETNGGAFTADAALYNVITDPAAVNPGLPGARLHNATGASISTTGWMTLAFASTIQLGPGAYFMAVVFSNPGGLSEIVYLRDNTGLVQPSWLGSKADTIAIAPYTACYEASATVPATANTTQTRVVASGTSVPFVALGAE